MSLRKVLLNFTAVSVGLFLLFFGLSYSSSYIVMIVNLHIIGFAGLSMGVSIILSITGYSKTKKRIWFSQFFLKIVFAFVLLCSFLYWGPKTHDTTGAVLFWERSAGVLHDELYEYADKNNGFLPDANSWCDSLLISSKNTNPLKSLYRLQREGLEFVRREGLSLAQGEGVVPTMAFNKFLSRTNVKELDGRLVLLFYIDAVGNVNGGQEMLEQFASKNHGHVFILFCDGTFADYDVPDNSMRFLKPFVDQKDYLPLRWKP